MHPLLLAAALAVAVQSGTPQTAQAWVATRADRYETDFHDALVVKAAKGVAKVRFRCITHGCEFPPSDQPDNVSRVDTRTYDVVPKKRLASIKLIVWTVTPENVIVVAQPSDRPGPQARFLLNER